MTEPKQHPEWVIGEAARLTGLATNAIKFDMRHCPTTIAFCDLIQETQKPPVDPALEEARERLAVKKAELGCPSEAQRVREGYSDKLSSVLLAIDLINERNALQAELDAVKLERDNLQKTRDALLEEITPLRNATLAGEFPEPKTLDPHAPLEARHKDGRVVPVELDCVADIGLIMIHPHREVYNPLSGSCITAFEPNGSSNHCPWTLHNRA